MQRENETEHVHVHDEPAQGQLIVLPASVLASVRQQQQPGQQATLPIQQMMGSPRGTVDAIQTVLALVQQFLPLLQGMVGAVGTVVDRTGVSTEQAQQAVLNHVDQIAK